MVSDKGALLAGGLFTWFFLASFIPWFLIDSAGRRKLLLTCISGMAAAFAIEAALVWKTQVSPAGSSASRAAGGAAIAILFVYMGLFTVSSNCTLIIKLLIDRLDSKLSSGYTPVKSSLFDSDKKVRPFLPLATGLQTT